jgi:hypothetical protein
MTTKTPALQARHYEFIAATLKASRPRVLSDDINVDVAQRDAWEAVVEAFATACERTNPKFDRERFRVAVFRD